MGAEVGEAAECLHKLLEGAGRRPNVCGRRGTRGEAYGGDTGCPQATPLAHLTLTLASDPGSVGGECRSSDATMTARFNIACLPARAPSLR